MQLETTTAVEIYDPFFTSPERFALSGFLAGHSGLTREAYALDLRQFASWCAEHHLALFGARRADIESFGRELEAKGRARATIARRLGTVTGFYRYAVEEGLIEHSPAAHVRKPRLDDDSHAVGLDRNEVGALLVAAGLAGARDHALVSLLCLNGLRSRRPSAPTSNAWPWSVAIARFASPARGQGGDHPPGAPHGPGHRLGGG